MKVYIDYIFVKNLIVDFILLKETAFITRNNIKNKNVLLGAVIGSSYVVILMLFKVKELNFLLSKILLAFIVVYICFKPKHVNSYIKLVMFFLIVSILNLGTFTMLSNLTKLKLNKLVLQIIFYVISLVISKAVISKMWKVYKREIKNEDLIYDVIFNIENKEYKYKAFLDTGNNVYSYINKLPILFAEKPKSLDFNKKISRLDKFEVQTTTLSNSSLKTAYVIDNIKIIKNNSSIKAKVGIVFVDSKFSNTGEYNMILNFYLYTEKMGGIKI